MLLKQFVRFSKYNPLIDEADLQEGNSDYSTVRLLSQRELTYCHLTPRGNTSNLNVSDTYEDGEIFFR